MRRKKDRYPHSNSKADGDFRFDQIQGRVRSLLTADGGRTYRRAYQAALARRDQILEAQRIRDTLGLAQLVLEVCPKHERIPPHTNDPQVVDAAIAEDEYADRLDQICQRALADVIEGKSMDDSYTGGP